MLNSGEFQVNNYTANAQSYPSVASFSNGDFVVTWQSDGQDGSGLGVYGQIFDKNGTKIKSEFQVNTYVSGRQLNPSVGCLSNGNFVMTWQSEVQDGANWGIFGQIFNRTGTKIGSEFQVNTYTTNDQDKPSVTNLGNGNFVVTWESYGQDSSSNGVFGQLFTENATKIGNEFQINTYTSNNQEIPSVTNLSNGNFVVTWMSYGQDGDGWGVFCQRFNGTGVKIGGEFRAHSYGFDIQWGPDVTSFPDGNFAVIWSSNWQDGDLNGVYGRLFNGQGEKIGNEFQVNTEFVNEQMYPNVASLSNDHFIVTWQSLIQDDSLWGVYGQLFDENASKIGNEFQVNTYILNSQGNPSVASLQNGNFVVTWYSFGQDGSNVGIFGQIFHDNFTLTPSTSTTSTSYTTITTSSSMTTTSIASTTSSRSSTTSSTAAGRGSSTTNVTTEAIRSTTSTTNPITTDKILVTSDGTSKIPSPSSNRNKVLLWLAFLFGGAACVVSFLQAGYLFFKSRCRKEGSDSIELRETNQSSSHDEAKRGRISSVTTSDFGAMRQSSSSPGEEHYHRTPDHVTEGAGEEPLYGLTPDHVTEGAGEEPLYGPTPRFVTPL